MKIELVDDWKQAYKYFSVWFFTILGALPQIYQVLASYGVISSETAPTALINTISVIAALGAIARVLKQNVDAELAKQSNTEAG